MSFFHAEGQGLPLESLKDGSYKVSLAPGASGGGRGGRGAGGGGPTVSSPSAPQRLEEELRLHQCSTRECIEQYYLDKLKQVARPRVRTRNVGTRPRPQTPAPRSLAQALPQRSLEQKRFGRLSVRCHYEAAEQRLVVEVLHAADLPPLDANGEGRGRGQRRGRGGGAFGGGAHGPHAAVPPRPE